MTIGAAYGPSMMNGYADQTAGNGGAIVAIVFGSLV